MPLVGGLDSPFGRLAGRARTSGLPLSPAAVTCPAFRPPLRHIFAPEKTKVVVLERLPVFYGDEGLDFARLTGPLAKSQKSCRNLSGDMSGRLAFSLLGISDEAWMKGQAHQQKRLVFVGFEDGRRGTILLHGFQHLWDAGAAAFCEAQLFEKLADAAITVAAGGKPIGVTRC